MVYSCYDVVSQSAVTYLCRWNKEDESVQWRHCLVIDVSWLHVLFAVSVSNNQYWTISAAVAGPFRHILYPTPCLLVILYILVMWSPVIIIIIFLAVSKHSKIHRDRAVVLQQVMKDIQSLRMCSNSSDVRHSCGTNNRYNNGSKQGISRPTVRWLLLNWPWRARLTELYVNQYWVAVLKVVHVSFVV